VTRKNHLPFNHKPRVNFRLEYYNRKYNGKRGETISTLFFFFFWMLYFCRKTQGEFLCKLRH